MSTRYRIADEARPSPVSHLVVQPFWPLVGLMFGGFWLAIPWYVFNSFAVGSPRRVREVSLAVIGVLGAFGITWALLVADARDVIATRLDARLGLLVLLAWKITICYALCVQQGKSFAIYAYYGGVVRNGMLVAAAAWFLGPRLFGQLELPSLISLAVR